MIIAGLTICAICGMVCQAVSTGYVVTTAKEALVGRRLYASFYSAAAPALSDRFCLDATGWTGCVAAIVAVQVHHGGDRRAGLGTFADLTCAE